MPTPPVVSNAQKVVMQKEVQEMLRKGAITKVNPVVDQFLSNLILVEKKAGGNCPVINLKHLILFIEYTYFKMEGLFLIKAYCLQGITCAK